jgi:hypothetical protein
MHSEIKNTLQPDIQIIMHFGLDEREACKINSLSSQDKPRFLLMTMSVSCMIQMDAKNA